MSSDLQSALELLVQNNYQSIILVVAVPYDYILTFSKEVEYVWRRPWSWVSTMFVLVRYIGLLLAMVSGLIDSSFVPGPLQVSTAIFLVGNWGFLVFLFAADVVMILRVYAMWNQSRTILWILVFIYVVQVITSVAVDGFYQNPNNTHLSVAIGQLASFTFCATSLTNVPLVFNMLKLVPRLALAAVLVILAVTQTLRQSVGMYKATKQWQLNRYMQLLVRDGIFYFVMNVLFQIASTLNFSPNLSATILFLSTFVYVLFFALVPRFIISIRELYDRDAHGRSHIDTGFGMRSQLNVGTNTTMSVMAFTNVHREPRDPEVEGDADNSGNIELEEVRRVPGQV
ncbi:hypothetical protein L210DRAFT_2520132 [Boletus edulis BED1]|uniref:DUF6533 domain-containing protein n=1 Tax=Boletus edulis BED1 TaxID=1328754 RepID=A0AAD4BB17_BOLED|nr:hypothetical protein L210DRAFT_2520132 [Boletus edulis BED1]